MQNDREIELFPCVVRLLLEGKKEEGSLVQGRFQLVHELQSARYEKYSRGEVSTELVLIFVITTIPIIDEPLMPGGGDGSNGSL
jgi:hypothetical protein